MIRLKNEIVKAVEGKIPNDAIYLAKLHSLNEIAGLIEDLEERSMKAVGEIVLRLDENRKAVCSCFLFAGEIIDLLREQYPWEGKA